MNYDQVKKIINSLALTCVFAISTLVANVAPANAKPQQWVVPQQPQWVVPQTQWVVPRTQWVVPQQQQWVVPQQVYFYPYGYSPYTFYPAYPYGYWEHHHGHHIRRGFNWLF